MTHREKEPNSGADEQIPLRERPIEEVAAALQDILGQAMVAYAIEERIPQRIGSFAESKQVPSENAEKILRDLAEVLEAITERDSPDIARAIMIGMNPALNDQAPIEVIHNGESDRVVAARFLLSD